MNNAERIAIAKLTNNIPEETVVRSYAEWNRRGMKIKKGAKAVFRIQIWVPKESDKDEETVDSDKMNLWWTNFFTPDAVEPKPKDFKPRKKQKS